MFLMTQIALRSLQAHSRKWNVLSSNRLQVWLSAIILCYVEVGLEERR